MEARMYSQRRTVTTIKRSFSVFGNVYAGRRKMGLLYRLPLLVLLNALMNGSWLGPVATAFSSVNLSPEFYQLTLVAADRESPFNLIPKTESNELRLLYFFIQLMGSPLLIIGLLLCEDTLLSAYVQMLPLETVSLVYSLDKSWLRAESVQFTSNNSHACVMCLMVLCKVLQKNVELLLERLNICRPSIINLVSLQLMTIFLLLVANALQVPKKLVLATLVIRLVTSVLRNRRQIFHCCVEELMQAQCIFRHTNVREVVDCLARRLRFVQLFTTFSIVQAALNGAMLLYNAPVALGGVCQSTFAGNNSSLMEVTPTVNAMGKYVLARNFETFIVMLASCVVVSRIYDTCIELVFRLINHKSNDDYVSNGSLLGTTLFFLCVQTNVTNMSVDQRVYTLMQGINFLNHIAMYVLHKTVDKALLKLANGNSHVKRRRFVISYAVGFAIMCYSAESVVSLCLSEQRGVWQCLIALCSIDLVIKVCQSFVIHWVILYERMYTMKLWTSNEIVHYVKIFCSMLSLNFSVLVFIDNVWLFIWSMEIFMIVLFNIPFLLKICLPVMTVMRRFNRSQVTNAKIKMLENAREHLNEICTICYSPLVDYARKTKCGHVYHERCLKKWLYQRNMCPLCKQSVFNTPAKSDHS